MLRYLLVIALTLSWGLPPARAGVATDLDPSYTAIRNAQLSQSPTLTVRASGFAAMAVYISLNRVAATSVTMRCTGGPETDLQADIGVAAVDSGGSITMSRAMWTYPVTKSTLLRINVAPLNDNYVRCVFGSTGATTDSITVYARLGGTP